MFFEQGVKRVFNSLDDARVAGPNWSLSSTKPKHASQLEQVGLLD